MEQELPLKRGFVATPCNNPVHTQFYWSKEGVPYEYLSPKLISAHFMQTELGTVGT